LIRIFLLSFVLVSLAAGAQSEELVTRSHLDSLMNVLVSDSLAGRGNYSPGLQKAAWFIAREFEKDSLAPFPGCDSYLHPFKTFENRNGSTSFRVSDDTSLRTLKNVVAVVKGSTHPGEIIIISAHYDHLGRVAELNKTYYGANDNASGTAVMLMLARYYAQRKSNARTLVFCAFAGEELGLHGSSAFSSRVTPDSVVAMLNFDMIGKARFKNSVVLTGGLKSNLYRMLKQPMKSHGIRLDVDHQPMHQYFQRSDNYPFALLGIPAHTFLASDDSDICYHKPCDDLSVIDFDFMLRFTQALIYAIEPLVNGKERPSRIR